MSSITQFFKKGRENSILRLLGIMLAILYGLGQSERPRKERTLIFHTMEKTIF